METIGRGVLLALGGFEIVAIIAALMGFSVMLLWNWLTPVLFGLPQISFWQALGLSVLCSILFNSPSSSSKK